MLGELRADSAEQWRSLSPELNVEGGIGRPSFTIGAIQELLGDLRTEGYVNVPNVLPPNFFQPLARTVELLHRMGVPLPFAFVYDEFWLAY